MSGDDLDLPLPEGSPSETVSEDEADFRFSLRVQLLSAEDIRRQSLGEVRTARFLTRDKRHFRADGLYSELIFGPASGWQAADAARADKFGHIEFPVPVLHPVARTGVIRRAVRSLAGLDGEGFDRLLAGTCCLVIERPASGGERRHFVWHHEIESLGLAPGTFETLDQAVALRWLLERPDWDAAIHKAREKMFDSRAARLLRMWKDSGVRPERLILDCLPVLHPAQRLPTVSKRGQVREHGLTLLYCDVLRRCALLRKMQRLNTPRIVLNTSTRVFFKTVESLLVRNSMYELRGARGPFNRPLESSLRERLEPLPESGRTRTWEASGRFPVAADPTVSTLQCGLPRTPATLELLRPLWQDDALDLGIDPERRLAGLRDAGADMWPLLERILPRYAVLLTQQGTRRRSAVQAFQPVLVNGRAVRLSPTVWQSLRDKSENDDVSVFLLTSGEACAEALGEVLADQGVNPASGNPVYEPTPDTVWGCGYLTRSPAELLSDDNICYPRYRRADDVTAEIERGLLSWNSPILWRPLARAKQDKWLATTAGRVIYHSKFPPGFPFHDGVINRRRLEESLSEVASQLGRAAARDTLREVESLAISALTCSGLSVGFADFTPPPAKPKILSEAQKNIDRKDKLFTRGLIARMEHIHQRYDIWNAAMQEIKDAVVKSYEMEFSRVSLLTLPYSITLLNSLSGMVGNAYGEANLARIPGPITASWGEGLGTADFWLSASGARLGALDTDKREMVAEQIGNILLRSLERVSITVRDCGTNEGLLRPVSSTGSTDHFLSGQVSCEQVENPLTDCVVIKVSERVTPGAVRELQGMGLPALSVRSPLTCEAQQGICQTCYGVDRATGESPAIGHPIGITAALALSEYADELTLKHIILSSRNYEAEHRARHDGTIDYLDLPVVRITPGLLVALRAGRVSLRNGKNRELEDFAVPAGAQLKVENGDQVVRGTIVCNWDPHVVPLIAGHSGFVELRDLEIGVNCEQVDVKPHAGLKILRSKRLRPLLRILNDQVVTLEAHFLDEGMIVKVSEWAQVSAGDVLCVQPEAPRDYAFVHPETELLDILRAGPRENTAILSPVSGIIESSIRHKDGRTITIRVPHGAIHEVEIAGYSYTGHNPGDEVSAGDCLANCSLPINPHDILRILGRGALHDNLLGRLRKIFEHNRIVVDEKHLELVVRTMVSYVEIEHPRDTDFVTSEIVTADQLRKEHERLKAAAPRAISALYELQLSSLDDRNRRRAESYRPDARISPAQMLLRAALTGEELPIDRLSTLAHWGLVEQLKSNGIRTPLEVYELNATPREETKAAVWELVDEL